MLMRQKVNTTYRCPNCGKKLIEDHSALRCNEHGMFFAYGPQLLVRAPQPEDRAQKPALPWELEELDDADER